MPDPFPPLFRLMPHLETADDFWTRAIGLMGRSGLPPGHGLLITQCRSIHTCFMRFPLDIIFLDRDNRPIKVIQGIKPWRIAWGGWQACSVLEVQSGWLDPSLVSCDPSHNRDSTQC